jgi:hypothetical protein
LDGYTADLKAGLAPVLLDVTYTGDCIRVRRASDNTEQDIGFDGNGDLDTSALTSFCTGTNCFIRTWYDQSGQGNNFTQTTTASQPKIYDSSTGVLKRNLVPAPDFDGSDDSMTQAVNLGIHKNVGYAHIYTVHASDTSTTQTVYFAATGDNANAKSRINVAKLNTNKANGGGRRLDADSSASVTSTGNLNNSTQYLHTAEFDFATSDLRQYINGSVDGSTTSFQTDGNTSNTDSSNSTGAAITLGSLGGTANRFDGGIQALIIYSADKSANRAAITSALNNYFNVY